MTWGGPDWQKITATASNTKASVFVRLQRDESASQGAP